MNAASSFPTLIPRAVLFADPQQTLTKLSHDGKYLSFLAPAEGVLNLWVAEKTSPSKARQLTHCQEPIRNYWWAYDNDHLLYIHDTKGNENWQLCAYQLSTGSNKVYTGEGKQSKIIKLSNKFPDKLLISLNERDISYFDVYLLNLNSQELKMVYENKEYWDFIADENLELQLALKILEQGAAWVNLNKEQESSCQIPLSYHDLFELHFYPQLKLELAENGRHFYFTQSITTNTAALMKYDLNNGVIQMLGHDNKADVYDVLLHPTTKQPLAYATYYDYKKWMVLDGELAEDFEFLKEMQGELTILSQTADNKEWIISVGYDDKTTQTYHYQRVNKTLKNIFNNFSDRPHYVFNKMHPQEIKVRDGVTCLSYLTLPSGRSAPYPLVLMVHGGPIYRDFWGFNSIHQWLSNRGYAVLSVNYRSSTGFGRVHTEAGFGEWGGKIHEDLLDAAKWAVETGITTQDKIAIMGRSFGGYATLVGLSFTPDAYCCGVDMVGPANLETAIQCFPPYWKPILNIIYKMVGANPQTSEGKAHLAKRSPLTYAQQISKPLLIGHGANDVQINQAESDKMVATLQANHIPVTYAIFPDEGHQFLQAGNRMAFYSLVEAFLAKQLGGQCEISDETLATSMIVKVDDWQLNYLK